MGSYRKGLTLSLGDLIRTSVDLHTVIASSSGSGLRRLCPTHHQPLKQRHYCPEGDHNIEWADIVYGSESGDGYKLVRSEDRPSFDANKELELIPVPVQQLDDSVTPGDGFYYCKPSDMASAKTWQIIHDILAKGKVAFIAKGALRQGSRKLWRLDLFRGYVVLREIQFPENIKPTPEIVDVKIDRNTTNLARQYVDALVSDWSKIDTTDELRAKFDEWVNQGEFVAAPDAVPDDTKPVSADDLQAALAAAVEKVKASR